MKLLKKIDSHLLEIVVTFFIFFIPLFPKFPFKNVNYTYISIRMDDLMVGIVLLVFLIQLIRRKISFEKLPYKKIFAAFWISVFASFLSGVFLTKTIDYPFVGLLHTGRRFEYMVIFFIVYAAVTSGASFKRLLLTFFSSMYLVNIYGVGQRFFEFPAVSTMNPEFAKGRILFLTPEARLSSTFAGHYDLAAFLVLTLPILWALMIYAKKLSFGVNSRVLNAIAGVFPIALGSTVLSNISASTLSHVPIAGAIFSPLSQLVVGGTTFFFSTFLVLFNRFKRAFVFATIVLSMLSLVLTASRTSSIAYLVSTLPFLLINKKFRYFIVALILSISLGYSESELAKRWADTIQIRQIVVNEKTGEEVVVQRISSDELPAGTAFIKSKKSLPVSLESELTKKDLIAKATLSGKLKIGTGSGVTTEDDYQVVSAWAADTSISTRFQVSWPRAVNAFMRNPLLGSGPSSITESSDGDYFRWIGETGALGALLFVGIIFMILKNLFTARKRLSSEAGLLYMSIIFGVFGLFVNALLIDVFEASKVAYMLWALLGLFVAGASLKENKIKEL